MDCDKKFKGCDHGIPGIAGLQMSWDSSRSDGKEMEDETCPTSRLLLRLTWHLYLRIPDSIRLEPSYYFKKPFRFANWHIRNLHKTSSQFYKSTAKKKKLKGKAEVKIKEQTFCFPKTNFLLSLENLPSWNMLFYCGRFCTSTLTLPWSSPCTPLWYL